MTFLALFLAKTDGEVNERDEETSHDLLLFKVEKRVGVLTGRSGQLKPTALANGFLVSKETMVLRRWGRSKPKFGFIKRVDIG